jgi:manganese oxidase
MKRFYVFIALFGLTVVVALSIVYVRRVTAAVSTYDPQIRTYYIAADEVKWDYAPTGTNQITGQPFGDTENVFVQNGSDRIGKVYIKAQYREYTDNTFTTLKPVPPAWQHLGILGPAIHAVVGDTIKVVFKNNTQFPQSMHPHGVFYAKNSEGAPYKDGTSGTDLADDAVPPGEMVTYTWEARDRSGPGSMDPSSVIWMYHSHVDEPGDTNAGLIGPIIITSQAMARPDGTPRDVDREIVAMFTVFDENTSIYLDENIKTYAGKPETVDPDDDGFVESNLMHSINGFVYGNLPLSALTMKQGERVRWYVIAQGTEVDLHTPHWHGNTVEINGMRTDVAELLPMSMKVANMVPDAAGTWLFHCHVNDHIIAGMQALYKVIP